MAQDGHVPDVAAERPDGAACTECGGPLDPALIAAGFTDHGERVAGQ